MELKQIQRLPCQKWNASMFSINTADIFFISISLGVLRHLDIFLAELQASNDPTAEFGLIVEDIKASKANGKIIPHNNVTKENVDICVKGEAASIKGLMQAGGIFSASDTFRGFTAKDLDFNTFEIIVRETCSTLKFDIDTPLEVLFPDVPAKDRLTEFLRYERGSDHTFDDCLNVGAPGSPNVFPLEVPFNVGRTYPPVRVVLAKPPVSSSHPLIIQAYKLAKCFAKRAKPIDEPDLSPPKKSRTVAEKAPKKPAVPRKLVTKKSSKAPPLEDATNWYDGQNPKASSDDDSEED